MTRILALLVLALLAANAQAQTPEGKAYALGPFDRIEVDGSANVRLRQGDRDEVVIAGDDDAQRSVEVDVVNNRLRIRPAGSWKFWNNNARVRIDVQMRNLSQLSLSGASDLHAWGPIKTERLLISISGSGLVRFDDLKAEQLKFDISGAGDGQLAGRVGELRLSVSGKGNLVADQLRASKARVSISGVGNANVWVTEALDVSISGIGSVDYWGQPEVKRSTSGLGSVNARGDKR